MRPRWVATIVVFIALLLLTGRTIDEPPRHYRVQLDVPPVDAALWFAARYPQYFTSGELGLAAWLEGLHPRDRVFVLAMAQTLTWTWVEHELARLESRDPHALAREASVLIRQKTLNQLEVHVAHYGEKEGLEFNTHLKEPSFAAGVFARLVRGASNCEGQNHLVALLLDTALNDAIAVEMVGVPHHDLVRVSGITIAQPIFVDPWSNLPPFSADPSQPADAPLLSELGDTPHSLVPEAAGREPFPAAVYQASTGVTVVLTPERDAPTLPVSLEIEAPKLDEASLERIDDPWQIYLYARILHIYDDPRAADVQRFLYERHCADQRPGDITFVCDAAAKLLVRLDPSWSPVKDSWLRPHPPSSR
ncbi:MAG TPA: hypothetical protein VM869_31515 [Enhygromyxa sp.]|nr:hypothetical protein [Enhygromyxa sp.]